MRLLEYEAKQILQKSGVAIPAGTIVANDTDISVITPPVVLKSQVPTGGRGKAGGVQIVTNANDVAPTVKKLFSLPIKGFLPHTLLAENFVDIAQEHYLSLMIDRDNECITIMVHKNGGIEVEQHAADEFLRLPIANDTIDDVAQKIADYLGHSADQITPMIQKLFMAFTANDATLLEVNPLIYTKNNELICGDCKMELDDAAVFRHPDWHFSSAPHDTNFVILDQSGTVGTIANGAGLAMATVDAVAAAGMTPANFLDIGGGANVDTILAAFRRMDAFAHLNAIVINIFAGITRCDEVARAIIAAKDQIPSLPPLYIRLAGTNFDQAVALLSSAKITTLSSLEECIHAAKEAS